MEAERCGVDIDCREGRRCLLGRCTEPCVENGDCPGTRSCVAGVCPEPLRCFAAEDCDPGRVCVGRRCRDSCAEQRPCPGLQLCEGETLLCEEPPRCATDGDCLAWRVCEAHVCGPPCAADGDCPAAQSCDQASGHCREPAVCRDDEDCLAGRACEQGSCFDSQCGEHADCAIGSCIDRRCGEEPEPACHEALPCPAAGVCLPLGFCAADGPCQADADCPAEAPLCHRRTGRCGYCRDRSDCTPAELCWKGQCRLGARCSADADCPGARRCRAELCEPADACPGDRFDGLPEPPLLAARTYTGLLLCDGTEDSYRVAVRAGQGLQIVLRHALATGDLGLILLGAGGAPVLATSETAYGVERVVVDGRPAAQEVELVVRGRAGFSTGYSLDLRQLEAATCAPDGWEGWTGNDDAAHAAAFGIDLPPIFLGTVSHAARLCPGDEDWYSVDLGAGTELSWTLGSPRPADLLLALHGPAGVQLAPAGAL
ncbi:MAG: hypothetical protein FJ125_17675, partial [Deltaproteobacteria bacterium]|nr:hypothetical protein [Deltaproteobacteria bacterium]